MKRTAEVFLRARNGGSPVTTLSEAEAPTNFDEAYLIQDTMAATYGAVGGWKVGGPEADEPFYAPMPAIWIASDGDTLSGPRFRLRGVEAEIAFQMGADLRPRERPYTREEVIAAVGQCVPAIEILEAGLEDPTKAPKFSMFGDMQMHGGFVPGPAIPNWQSIDWAKQSVQLVIDGKVAKEGTASNPAGTDLIRLLVYLANQASARTNGLRKDQWITTGSWTGGTWLKAGQSAEARFSTAGSCHIKFA